MGNPIKGTNVFGPVVPFNTDDIYASHKATYGQGGWRTAKNLTERNAILLDRREDLMIVAVEDNSFTNSTSGAAFYLLDIHHNASTSTSLLDNNNWVLLNLGYGGDGWIFPPPPQSIYQGKKGQRSFDDTYLYICVEDNLWKRVAIDWFIDNGTSGFSNGTSGLNFGDVPIWGTNGQWVYEYVVKNVEAIDSTAGNLLVTFTNNSQKILEIGGDRWILPAPMSSVWPGQEGDRSYDDNYFYVCIQDNLWKRSAFDFFIFGGSTSGGGGSFFSLPNGYVPIWNSTLGNWEFNKVVSNVYFNGTNNELNVRFTNNYTTAFSINVVELLSELSDVTINNATSGDILAYNGSKWVNQMFPGVKWILPAPLTSTSTGKKGDLSYDDNFIYVCVETNTWKRINIDYFVFSGSTSGGFSLPLGSVPVWNGMSYDTTIVVSNVEGTIIGGEYGNLVTYTNGTTAFIPFNTSGAAFMLNLSGLSDVQVNVNSSSGIGQFLKWNGTKWVNSKIPNATTAGNGLTLNNSTVELGGKLNKNTVINGTNFNLTFNLNEFIVNAGTNSSIFKINNIDRLRVDGQGIGLNTQSANHNYGYFRTDNLTQTRYYQMPDKDGIVAMLSDFTTAGYLPLIGGKMQGNIDMNNFDLTTTKRLTNGNQFIDLNFFGLDYLVLSANSSGLLPFLGIAATPENQINMQISASKAILFNESFGLAIQSDTFIAGSFGLTSPLNSGIAGYLDTTPITDNRIYTLPDKSGTVALLDDIFSTTAGILLSTAGNGLSVEGSAVHLGGILTKNTTIDINNKTFTITDGGLDIANFKNGQLLGTNVLSIDFKNRKMYDAGGSNVTLDWNNAKLNSFGGQLLVDWNNNQLFDFSTNNLSIDWNSRNLYSTAGVVIADWKTNAIRGYWTPTNPSDLVNKAYVDSLPSGSSTTAGNGLSMVGNEVQLGGELKRRTNIHLSSDFPVTSSFSITDSYFGDVFQPQFGTSGLYIDHEGFFQNVELTGFQTTADNYKRGFAVHQGGIFLGDLHPDYRNKSFSDKIRSGFFFESSLNIFSFYFQKQETINFRYGTAKSVTQDFSQSIESLNWSDRNLSATSGLGGNNVITVDWANKLLKDNNGIKSIDWANRLMYDSSGTRQSIDWGNRFLVDINQIFSVDYSSRALFDDNSNTVLNWRNRTLSSTTGLVIADFTTNAIRGYWTPSNNADLITKTYLDTRLNNITSENTTAGNGLSIANDNKTIKLGGVLTENTTILNGGNSFTLSGTVVELTTDDGNFGESYVGLYNTEFNAGFDRQYLYANSDIVELHTVTGMTMGVDKTNGAYLRNASFPFRFGYLKVDNLSADRIYQYPNNSGTIALLSDIDGESTTAGNGLLMVGKQVTLGGDLYKNTEINTGLNIFTISGTGGASNTKSNLNIQSDTATLSSYHTDIYHATYVQASTNQAFLGYEDDYSSNYVSAESRGAVITAGNSGNSAILTTSLLSDNRNYQFPDESGILALRNSLFVQTITQSRVGDGINAQSEVSLISSSSGNLGSTTIAANTLAVGDIVKLKLRGYMNISATGTFTFNVKLGSTTLVSRSSVVISHPKTNQLIDLEFEFIVRQIGSSGKILGNGVMIISVGTVATPVTAEFVMTNAATIDTTAAQKLDFTVAWSAGFSGNLNTTTAYIKKEKI